VGLALLGAIFFSGKAIVVKLAYAHPVDASTLLAMRMLLSLIFTVVREKNAVKMTAKDYGLITLAGLLGYYLASLFDFMGLQYITAGLERLILFTYPSIVLLITCIMKQKWPQPWQLACMALSYVGLAVVYGHETVLLGDNTALGVVLVFISAICYASYLVVGESLLKRLGTIRVTAMATLVSAAAILIQINVQQPLNIILEQPLPVWGWSLVNAVFCTFVPVFAVMTAISLIGAPRVSQLGMIGPIATIALGTWILNEPFTVWHAAGTALVIAGVALLSMKKEAKEGTTT
jgi:drug/metabolite transporter (DMT)-like permease